MNIRKPNLLWFLALWLGVLALGILGYFEWQPWNINKDVKVTGFANWFNSFYAALMLFAFGGDSHSDAPTLVDMARLSAIVFLWSGIAWALWARLAQHYEETRARRWENHVVVIGLGERGREFAESAVRAKKLELPDKRQLSGKVLAIDIDPKASYADKLRSLGAVVVQGTGDSAELLSYFRVDKAAVVVVVTRDDATNVAVANCIASLTAPKNSLLTRLLLQSFDMDHQKNREASRVYVQIDNDELRRATRDNHLRLVRQAQSASFALAGDAKECSVAPVVEPFSGRDLVASAWFREVSLHRWAMLRGQSRLHLVVVGLSEMSLQVIQVFMQLAPCPKFSAPIVTLLLDDLSEDAEGENVSESLDRLRVKYPRFSELPVELRSFRWRPQHDVLSDKFLSDVEGVSPISAVVIGLESDNIGSTVALNMRQATRQLDRWRAPIYVHLQHRSGLEHVVNHSTDSKRFSDVLESFGSIEVCCTLELLVLQREEIPKAIHTNYQSLSDISEPELEQLLVGSESGDDFSLQEDTYRSSNRRQAEHIPVKLASLGFEPVTPSTEFVFPAGTHFDWRDGEMEKLAIAEHESWLNDRLLDGWKASPGRDNRRMLHNTMVSFDELEGMRNENGKLYTDFDFEAVKFITNGYLAKIETGQIEHRRLWKESSANRGAATWKKIVKIALIGKLDLSKEEAQYLQREMRKKLDFLAKKYSDCLLRFVTPLAPGSDLLMAQAVQDAADRHKNVEMKLVVLEAVPRDAMLEDYKEKFNKGCWPDLGSQWDNERCWTPMDASGPASNIGGEFVGKKHLQNAIQAVAEQGELSEWIVEITEAGTMPGYWESEEIKRQGYAKASKWMVEHCDVLIACRRSHKRNGEPDTAKSVGGTNWTVERWVEKMLVEDTAHGAANINACEDDTASNIYQINLTKSK